MGTTRVEWPTLALLAGTYAVWMGALWLPVWAAVPILAWVIAQHASLIHEAIHGHPFRSARLNALAVAPPLTLLIPYARFRDTHLAHHRDATLTDPFDDPESNYLCSARWNSLPGPVRALLRLNNRLAGRVLVGPAVGLVTFALDEWRAGDGRAWAAHLPWAAGVLAVVWVAPLPVWAYLLAVYGALGLLKIRTFLEHQAHEHAAARSVIIEDRGPLALLFLNNNLHVVHHMHPDVPWYRLPALYRANAARYLGRNGNYRYRSYGEVFRSYLWRAKDPVAHPLWHREDVPQ